MKSVSDIIALLPADRQTSVASRANELIAGEIKNGWTVETLAAYQRERDKVADVTPGNVVTEFKRGRPAVQIQGAGRSYDPFTRSFK